MFNTRFNNGYQNMNDPNMNMNDNGYRTMPQDPYSAYSLPDPYAMFNQDSSMMPNVPYPTPPVETNTAYPQGYNPTGYAKGGTVKKKKGAVQDSPYPMLAEMIRQQGNGEDTVLAHINPLEAMMLKSMGGSGTINKKTGLPQFGLFSNPGKWFKSVAGGGLGAIIGNMLLPGVGGLIGGALGGAGGSAIRGRKDFGQAALRGLGMGAMLPTVAGLAGSGLSSMGATGAGGALTSYGEKNAIMPALGNLFGGGSGASGAGGASILSSQAGIPQAVYPAGMSPAGALSATGGGLVPGAAASAGSGAASGGFFNNLLGGAGSFLSKPQNLLAALSVGSSLINRPKEKKEKTPEELASEKKRLDKALMLSPEERSAKEAELVAEARMQRSASRKQFLPEERLGNLEPLYRKSHTPEEQKRYGKWFSYYNNPDFSGEPAAFAEGGLIEAMGGMDDMGGMGTPSGSSYIDGMGGGQDDNVRTSLPDNSYIIDASTVSDLGDGNSKAGANKLVEALISNGEFYISPEDVARFGMLGAKNLNSMVKNVRKHKGGAIKLPPKARPLASYLKK